MSETSSSNPPETPFQEPLASQESTASIPEYMPLHPLVQGFYDYCQEQGVTLAAENEPPKSVPELAHTFIRARAASLPEKYRHSWHTMVPGKLVIRNIHRLLADSSDSPDAVVRAKRQAYLHELTEEAMGHYNKFPEILGARYLADRLEEIGDDERARDVRLLLAAYGATMRNLPPGMKEIPSWYR